MCVSVCELIFHVKGPTFFFLSKLSFLESHVAFEMNTQSAFYSPGATLDHGSPSWWQNPLSERSPTYLDLTHPILSRSITEAKLQGFLFLMIGSI